MAQGRPERDYGTVTVDGQRYRLTRDTVLSDRLFTGSWHDTSQDGDQYRSEWMAPAQDRNGNDVTIYWQFDAVRGEEPEDDSAWPWDDAHSSRVEIR